MNETDRDNAAIARRFEEVALLLELEEGNPFRIQAYRNAAQTVVEHPRPLQELVAEGADLTQLDFIGKDLAATIAEVVTTGKLPVLEEITQRVPATLLEVMRIPGLGPKKARKLWRALGVTTLEQLEAAARDGHIAELDGFGKKSQQTILERVIRRREGEQPGS